MKTFWNSPFFVRNFTATDSKTHFKCINCGEIVGRSNLRTGMLIDHYCPIEIALEAQEQVLKINTLKQ